MKSICFIPVEGTKKYYYFKNEKTWDLYALDPQTNIFNYQISFDNLKTLVLAATSREGK